MLNSDEHCEYLLFAVIYCIRLQICIICRNLFLACNLFIVASKWMLAHLSSDTCFFQQYVSEQFGLIQ